MPNGLLISEFDRIKDAARNSLVAEVVLGARHTTDRNEENFLLEMKPTWTFMR
jgi:hypothetical protein